MTTQPEDSITSYIPTDLILPEDPKELRRSLDDTLKKVIDSTNEKDIGHYNTVQNVNGQRFFDPSDPQKFHNVFRKVINFGTLPDTSTKSVPHGITTTGNTIFTRIYGTANEPGVSSINSAFPLAYGAPGGTTADVALYLDATNVYVKTEKDRSAYTICYIILEWIENV